MTTLNNEEDIFPSIINLAYKYADDDDFVYQQNGDYLIIRSKKSTEDGREEEWNENLKQMFVHLIQEFSPNIHAIKIVINKRLPSYYLLPWPKKNISFNLKINIDDIFERGNRIYVKPKKNWTEGKRLKGWLQISHLNNGREVWLNPNISIFDIKNKPTQ